MTIRRLVQSVFATLTIVALLVSLVIWIAVQQRRSLVDLYLQRFRSYQLAGDLRRSSDYLTQFARMYVATGDARYEAYYRDVLAIRSGTKPRPEAYERVYWDFYLDGHKPPRGNGPPMALRELLRRQGINDTELAQLLEAEGRSNALAVIEETAIHAVRGEFRDASGAFTRRGPPDRAMANRLLHDSTYLREKARIMQPIGDFLSLVDARNTAELEEFTRRTQRAVTTLEGLLALFVVLVIASYPVLRSRILVPVSALQRHTTQVARDLDRLATAARDIAQGDLKQSYSVDTSPIRSTRPDEIGDLSRLHDEMIRQLQSAGGSIATITAGLKRAHEISKQRFVAIFQESPMALAVSVADTGEFVEVNRALLNLLGAKDYSEVIGKTSEELGIWSAQQRQTTLEPLRKTGKLESMRIDLRRLDGKTRSVEISAAYYEAEGVLYVLSSTADVTEKLTLEAQFRQAQKMDAMGRLAGGIAHDFNNLLTVIIGFGQLTIGEMAKGKGSKADVEEMVRAAERAAEMTRQLLAFSRKQVVEMRDLSLNAVLGSIEKMLKRMIGDDVRFKSVLADDVGTIRADSGQIEQVVTNLAVNARDAMPTGGTVTMTTSNVVLDSAFVAAHPEARPGEFVRLAVSDTGTGMSKETMDRIFEPFFTTKEVGRGTGLGLPTVFAIVEQSNGFLIVESEVGRGTTFSAFFPRVQPQGRGASPDEGKQAAGGGRETVLVAEDNAALRDLMTRVLSERGYTVLASGNAEEALALAARHAGKIDLLLTDVVMPGMNGRTLAEKLAITRPGARVLYASGYTDDVLGRHGVLDANIQLLAKPFTPETLAAKVREILDS